MFSRLLSAAFIAIMMGVYTAPTMATEHPINQDVTIVIADTYYHNPVNLAHAYRQHWHTTGKLLENAITTHNQQVQFCKQQQNAKLVISLEPYLFYNAQLQTYFAEIIAKGYTQSDTKQLTLRPSFTIKEQVSQFGSLMVTPDFFAQKAYEKAVAKLMTSLNQHKDYQAATNKQAAQNMDNLCVALEQSRPSKLYY